MLVPAIEASVKVIALLTQMTVSLGDVLNEASGPD